MPGERSAPSSPRKKWNGFGNLQPTFSREPHVVKDSVQPKVAENFRFDLRDDLYKSCLGGMQGVLHGQSFSPDVATRRRRFTGLPRVSLTKWGYWGLPQQAGYLARSRNNTPKVAPVRVRFRPAGQAKSHLQTRAPFSLSAYSGT